MKLYAKGKELDLSYPHIMGILNVTPDSFSDGGKYNTINKALMHVNDMKNSGATIIDVGGESTRPGAFPVSIQEELDRVIPVIEQIIRKFDIWVSVDTSKPQIIKESIKAGVHIINDVRSLQSSTSLEEVAKTDLPVCIVHMQGNPSNMQINPYYYDVCHSVYEFFIQNINRYKQAGIQESRIILDPGFGFGKTIKHNYTLLSRLDKFKNLGLPLMVGISRKSMVNYFFNSKPNQCLNGSLTCAIVAIMKGARIVRVHDVQETMEVLRILNNIIYKDNYIAS